MPDYRILVCPVCREQVSEDYETGGYCYDHQYATAQEVVVHLDSKAEPQLALAAFCSQEDKRDADWSLAHNRYVSSLTDEERREYLGPMAYAMDSMIRQSFRDMAEDYKRTENFWKGFDAHH